RDLHYPLRRQRQMCIRDRFSTVHVDLMGLYGEDETWGAGAQLSMTF
ncbi:hypothetical protein, partial [Enterobacter asburiae]